MKFPAYSQLHEMTLDKSKTWREYFESFHLNASETPINYIHTWLKAKTTVDLSIKNRIIINNFLKEIEEEFPELKV